MKRVLSWLLVLVWLIIIFMLSNMDSLESNKKSMKTINKVIEKTIDKSNDIGIINSNINKNKIDNITIKLNVPMRKCMHFLEYFILSILLLNAINIYNKKVYIINIILCLIFSSFDEIHQIFIFGRSAKILDVLIDMSGSIVGELIFILFKKRRSS